MGPLAKSSIQWRAGWLTLALMLLGLIAVACQGNPPPTATVTMPPAEQGTGYAQPELLADTIWLEENLGRDRLVILDVRSSATYSGGHIPGAMNLSPRALDDNKPVRGMVGPPEQAERVLEDLGISDDSQVVIYDADRGMWAARVFWVLDYYGKRNVSVLNGGFARWQKEGREVSKEITEITPGTLTLVPNEARNATKEYVLTALGKSEVVLLDERTPREYSGEVALSARGGRIPGAVNVPWDQAMTSGETEVWKSQAELAQLYKDAGVSPDREVVVYCQTGVRAAHTYFTIRLIGYDNVRVYDGSWEEWGNDPGLPLERD